jgi:hypothetical protein
VLDAFQFVTFGAPEALCIKGVSYYEFTLLAAVKKSTNDVQAGFATADFRVLGDAAGHSPDGAHPTHPRAAAALCTGRLQPHAMQAAALCSGRLQPPAAVQAAAPIHRRRRRCRVVGCRRCAEAQVVQGAGAL